MRLTKKGYLPLELNEEQMDVYQKLSIIEDFEEELGIDLLKVISKNQEVWFKKEITEYDSGGNWYEELGKQTIIHNSIVTAINFDKKTLYIKGAKMWVDANDYGKT